MLRGLHGPRSRPNLRRPLQRPFDMRQDVLLPNVAVKFGLVHQPRRLVAVFPFTGASTRSSCFHRDLRASIQRETLDGPQWSQHE